MKNFDYDVIVVGGGPAGMGAGIASAKAGARTLIVERENKLGGILKQCIHSGFGLHFFGEELTGPEYAHKFIEEVEKTQKDYRLEVLLETFVLKVESNAVTIKNRDGVKRLSCGSVVLGMGCRERTAGAISLKGSRPSGVWTAGQAQKWVNMYGCLPCKKPIILGSGDIGLIMARRLTFEGAKPLMVLEVQPQTSGLVRNLKQCLEDFDIPLHLNTTVVEVLGYPQINGVVVAKVDKNLQPIEETKQVIECDGLILSVGLIPETELIRGVKMNSKTNSAMVNEFRETSLKNVFACGNVLHVHDLVDFVTEESLLVGENSALNAFNKLNRSEKEFEIVPSNGVRYTIPNSYFRGAGKLKILFRVTRKFVRAKIEVLNEDGGVAFSKFVLSASAGEMQQIEVDKSKLAGKISVRIKEGV